MNYLKAGLTIVAVLTLVVGGANWVWGAEQEHDRAREIERISKQQAEIIKKHEQWITTEEALRIERERFRQCLAANPNNTDRCIR